MTTAKKKIEPRPARTKASSASKQTTPDQSRAGKCKTTILALDEEAEIALEKATQPPDLEDNRTIEQKKKDVISALNDTLGVAVVACARAKVDFDLFCQWRINDQQFESQVARVNDVMLDFVEAKALEQIKAGNPRLIQFYLQTKGRSRGFDPKETGANSQMVALLTADEMNF